MAPKVYEAPKFYPSHRDMAGPFEKYIESIEDELAEYGLGIIVPPRGWKPTSAKYESMNFEVPKPIRQHVTGSRGIYQSVHVEQKGMSLQDFKTMANAKDNLAPLKVDTLGPEHDDLERYFWKNVTHFPPLYGADAEGSLFDPDHKGWNIRDLDTCLSKTLKEHGASLPGVTTPYLYVGMWRSMFAWHTEDVDLYSVNYLHFGEPKSWYCIPPALRTRFELVVQGLAPEFHRNCPEFLRHKETLVTPFLIQQHNIPLVKAVQTPGQWIINFPSAYHSGFNHGFNCAESTNFATRRWIEYGAKAKACKCSGESVRIDMRLFGVEPPPPKIKPGTLLLAPPLPAPAPPGAAVPPAAHGKMVKRKAQPVEGVSIVAPSIAAEKQPNMGGLTAVEAAPPTKKQKAPGSSKKKRKAEQENVLQLDPGLAPALGSLPVPPPAKKPKAAGGSGSSKKKGVADATVANGVEPAASGGLTPKASKSKKAKATQGAPANGSGLPLKKTPKKAKGTHVAPGSGSPVSPKKGSPPKAQAGRKVQGEGSKQKAKKQKKGGNVGLVGAAQSVQAPKAKGVKKTAKGAKAGPLVIFGGVESVAPKSRGGANTLAHAGGVEEAKEKVKVPKIIRIKFNPPAGLLMPPTEETAPVKAQAVKNQVGPVSLKQGGAHKKGGQEVTPAKGLPLAAVQPSGGALTVPPQEGGLSKVSPPETPGAQPKSADDPDRIQTRRRGALLDEPLAVLFKDPPTGTKLQGRKRVSGEAPLGIQKLGGGQKGAGSLGDLTTNSGALPKVQDSGRAAAQGGSLPQSLAGGVPMQQLTQVPLPLTPLADLRAIHTVTPSEAGADMGHSVAGTAGLEGALPEISAVCFPGNEVPPVGSITLEPSLGIVLPSMLTPVEGSADVRGSEAPGGNQPAPLPKLVSPTKHKKGKKKGGCKQPARDGSQEEMPKVSKPRPRRRGIPPERPATHQMQRRSRANQPPVCENVQEDKYPPLQMSAQEESKEHIGASAGAGTKMEAAHLVVGEALKEGVESRSEEVGANTFSGDKVAAGKETGEVVQELVERLKGGAADEASLEEPPSAVPEELSPSRGVSSPPQSARGGMVVMRVEGSRLVLRRVKQTAPPLESEGQEQGEDGAVGGTADSQPLTQQPEAEAASEGQARPASKRASDAPACVVQEECWHDSKAELCAEPVECEVVLPTSPVDRELEVPKALPIGPLHLHTDSKHSKEEALDTSSHDSLILTYPNEDKLVH